MANLTCSEFTSYIVSPEPVYSDLILSDIRPTDGEIGHFEVGTWPAAADDLAAFGPAGVITGLVFCLAVGFAMRERT
mgnify:CR=1 FL=1